MARVWGTTNGVVLVQAIIYDPNYIGEALSQCHKQN